ncbi:hypothetical protein ACSNOB_16685 [Micromonospora sp. URMC 106]|uniref:hypothetical protein n=1 Tax=Micromonospora sp. URMC 106 TaxID=3423408 RepID=UPI003F1E2009
MRALLSTCGPRGVVEPPVGPAVRLRELGAEVRVRAPTGVGSPLGAALTAETRVRANAAAGTIRTDGAAVTAALLLDPVSPRQGPRVPA